MPGRSSSGGAALKQTLKQAERRVFQSKYGRSSGVVHSKQPPSQSFLLDKFERPQRKAAFVFEPTKNEPMRRRRGNEEDSEHDGMEDEQDDGGGHVQRIINTYTVAPEPVLKLGQRTEQPRLVAACLHA
jgi:hypothetical protein